MTVKTFTALALAALIGGSTLGLAAQTFAQTPMPMDEDPLDDRSRKRLDRMEKVVRELRAIVFQGRDTGQPVVVQPAGTDEQMQSLSQRVTDLEQTLTRLNEQNESLIYELDQARRALEASQAQVQTLNTRLAPLERAAAAQQLAAEQEAALAAQDPDEAFANAAGLMNGGDFDGAEAALADFVQRHPDHAKAAEANYMLGKAYSVRSAHNDAAAAFIASVRGYPKAGWAADALAELSKSLIALKRAKDACATLDTLKAKYPKPSAAVTKKAAAARTQAKCAA
jgi:tol-pal system protein YbgF